MKQNYNQDTITLSPEDNLRYARHFTLANVGVEGQKKLKAARVLCVGAGGLGSPVLLYLAAAGVGTLAILDDDVVELSNLQRQVLYDVEDLKKKKAEAAKRKLTALNPNIDIIALTERLTKHNALTLLRDYDIIVDGTDNFVSRYLINDACFYLDIPHVYASISQFEGQVSVFDTKTGPCYRCLYDSPPPKELTLNCSDAGVLGVLPGVMGTIQATEVLKFLLDIGSSLIGRLLTFDALSMTFREFNFKKDLNCRLCAQQQAFATLPNHEETSCETNDEITVQQLQQLRQQQADFVLLDVRDEQEYALCNLGGLHIPLAELSTRLLQLDKNKYYIVHCKLGIRSKTAMEMLRSNGFNQVKYLRGGIIAWAKEIDPTVPLY